MSASLKEIGLNLKSYVDDQKFIEESSPEQICQALDYAKLSPEDFSTLFNNLSYKHTNKSVFLQMLSHAKIASVRNEEQAQEVANTISQALGISAIKQLGQFIADHPEFKEGQPHSQVEYIPKRTESDSPDIDSDSDPEHINPNNLRVIIHSLTGRKFMIVINKFMRISELKALISTRANLSVDSIRLIYKGLHLNKHGKIEEYNIKSGDTIHVIERLRGEKPVIYLYPQSEMDVKIGISIKDGAFSFVYPSFDHPNEWNVRAYPNGDIIHNGKKLKYLFWETLFYPNIDLNKGFVVHRDDVTSFFEEKLKLFQLNSEEICDFVTYWVPKLVEYEYVLISFQFANFDEICPLTVTPKPDNMIRVFFAARPLVSPIEIPVQEIPTYSRTGFTVVEWGGTIIDMK